MPKKDSVLDRQKITLRYEKAKTKTTEKCFFEFQNKNNRNQPATLYEILLVKSAAAKDQIKKNYHKMRLLTHPDAGGDDVFFKTINQAYQILINDGAREAYNIFGLDFSEKLLTTKTDKKLFLGNYNFF